ncbi:MAG TPA: hypothetical protein VFB42_13460 [Gaiellaceae bacterium]|nr:hypothetical protein [Gaiellaceae bacterium]
MDAGQALADLTEISSQVVHAAIIDGSGALLAATIPDAGRAARFAAGVRTLLEEADALARERGLPAVSQLEAATLGGSVFAVRREAGAAAPVVAATTHPDATAGLVFYDLKHCLASLGEPPAGGGRPARRKAADAA